MVELLNKFVFTGIRGVIFGQYLQLTTIFLGVSINISFWNVTITFLMETIEKWRNGKDHSVCMVCVLLFVEVSALCVLDCSSEFASIISSANYVICSWIFSFWLMQIRIPSGTEWILAFTIIVVNWDSGAILDLLVWVGGLREPTLFVCFSISNEENLTKSGQWPASARQMIHPSFLVQIPTTCLCKGHFSSK